MERTWIFRLSNIRQKEYVERMWILRPPTLYRKKCVETTWIFRLSKLHEKSTWKQQGFFDQRNSIEKVRGNDVEIRRNLVFHLSM